VRHRVPSRFNWTVILQRVLFIAVLTTASCPANVTADAGYLWDRPAMFGVAIKKTLYLSGNFFLPPLFYDVGVAVSVNGGKYFVNCRL
jgi:hypothetical protein